MGWGRREVGWNGMQVVRMGWKYRERKQTTREGR